MRFLLVSTIVFSAVTCQYSRACGGGHKSVSGGSFAGFNKHAVPNLSAQVAPGNQMIAMTNGRINAARQAATMHAIAYNARMRPIRLANAARVRETKLARREARKTIMLAKLEAERRQQQEFLARARRWTDSTGRYQVVAILADANEWGVKLRRADGSFVNVPMHRLSMADQTWAIDKLNPSPIRDRTMLARL